MGFGEDWMKWMEAVVFSSKMSVLVNGSPMKEFVVERNLRQGDPISPFLFLIVMEGLRGMVNKDVENGDFEGFNINGNYFVEILQFANDTILVGDESWKHIWAIKAVLRGFNLVLGMKVNEFIFLGIPIGGNAKRISMWKGLVSKPFHLYAFFLISSDEGGGCGYRRLERQRVEVGDSGVAVCSNGDTAAKMQELQLLLLPARLDSVCRDVVEWALQPTVGYPAFSVRNFYDLVNKFHIPFGPANLYDEALCLLWKMKMPNKIKVFGWRRFINRLPYRDSLVVRGIPISTSDLSCVFCRALFKSLAKSFLE
ncbi:uncharacterized protein LOC131652768 [Vicia villosa]|uniref:uncharacterized protein LOC131652768 n=1 Tax=Vicia villosa TaxID=3911 RepID=UPI00273AAECE|nr:uncharacterized protein LOC131652768 [Vicia villosa]